MAKKPYKKGGSRRRPPAAKPEQSKGMLAWCKQVNDRLMQLEVDYLEFRAAVTRDVFALKVAYHAAVAPEEE